MSKSTEQFDLAYRLSIYAMIGLLFMPAAAIAVVVVPCILVGWAVVRLARFAGIDLLTPESW